MKSDTVACSIYGGKIKSTVMATFELKVVPVMVMVVVVVKMSLEAMAMVPAISNSADLHRQRWSRLDQAMAVSSLSQGGW